MARTITDSFGYVCTVIKASFLPALFLATGLIIYLAQEPLENGVNQMLFNVFIGISVVGLTTLYMINSSKPFFSFLLGFTIILFLNELKKSYGAEFIHHQQYIWLSFLLPFALMFLYFLPVRSLKSNYGAVILLILLGLMTFIEHIDEAFLVLPYGNILWESMPLLSMLVWWVFLSLLIIDISFKNNLISSALFYADLALFLEFMYVDNNSAIAIFSLVFAIILYGATLFDLYYRYRHDELNNVNSYNVYVSRTAGKFPFKYTVGVFVLDNRDKILAEIGYKKIAVLEQMLIDEIIDEAPDDAEIYRYRGDEFLLVFKNEDAKHAYEYCDNIRRAVAAAEFIFSSKKSVKITISICVSEKTRKYIDANIVAERGHNGLQKGGRFNYNIVTMAG